MFNGRLVPGLLSNPVPSQLLLRRTADIRFRQLITGAGNPENNMPKMEETEKPEVLSQSIPGDGYATRSDEKGFGETYGGNAEEMPEQDKYVRGKVPEYGTDQEKQKEMAHHQYNSAK